MNNCPYCNIDTGGNHEYNCPNNTNYFIMKNYGWICTLCGRSNAQFVITCPCYGQYTNTPQPYCSSTEKTSCCGSGC
jgi:hypothetical protein